MISISELNKNGFFEKIEIINQLAHQHGFEPPKITEPSLGTEIELEKTGLFFLLEERKDPDSEISFMAVFNFEDSIRQLFNDQIQVAAYSTEAIQENLKEEQRDFSPELTALTEKITNRRLRQAIPLTELRDDKEIEIQLAERDEKKPQVEQKVGPGIFLQKRNHGDDEKNGPESKRVKYSAEVGAGLSPSIKMCS